MFSWLEKRILIKTEIFHSKTSFFLMASPQNNQQSTISLSNKTVSAPFTDKKIIVLVAPCTMTLKNQGSFYLIKSYLTSTQFRVPPIVNLANQSVGCEIQLTFLGEKNPTVSPSSFIATPISAKTTSRWCRMDSVRFNFSSQVSFSSTITKHDN